MPIMLRETRSKSRSEKTPETGATSSTETNTTSTGTGTSTTEQSGSSKQKVAENVEREVPVNVEENEATLRNRSNPGTVVNASQANSVSVLMAELEAQTAELARAQAAAAVAKSRLEIAKLSDRANSSEMAAPSRVEESVHIEKWLSEQRLTRLRVADRSQNVPGIENVPSQPTRPAGERGDGTDIQSLANAIVQAVNSNSNKSAPPPKFIHELPHFDGTVSEWMAFRAVFVDTESMFSDIQNVARLRKAIRGPARESVRTLLYAATDPLEIIDTLERRYGRPEMIVLSEVENIKRMPRLNDDGRNIISFANKVANTVATIKALRQDQYLYSPELVNRIVDKLSVILKYKWFEFKATHSGAPDLILLTRFLNTIGDQCGSMFAYENARDERRFKQKPKVNTARHRSVSESSASTCSEDDYEPINTVASLKKTSKNQLSKHVKKSPKNQFKKQHPPPQPEPAPVPPQGVTEGRKCVVCSGEHAPPKCADFIKLNIDDRWEKAKHFRLCFRCLTNDHRRYFRCKYVPCGENGCEASHHKLLHNEKKENKESPNATRGRTSTVVNHVHQPSTYLKIMPVEISGSLGTITTHALLDEGSSITLIETAIADEIIPGGQPNKLLSIEGVGGNKIDDYESRIVKLSIKGLCSRELNSMSAHTIRNLDLASQRVDSELVRKCDHLRDIEDELCYENAKPTILIGQDNWHLITSRQLKIGGKHEPVASLTKLGWVLHGKDSLSRGDVAHVNHLRPVSCNVEDETVKMMRDFFSMESLGIEAKTPRADPEQRALKLLNDTCRKIDGCNRYEAGLLWRSDDVTMPDNRAQALSRLINLEKKLDRNEEQRKEYGRQVDNLIQAGYAEKVDTPSVSNKTWYLPHFAVVHPQKGKIRLVFDAAAKSGGKSLNDALLAGPDLLQSLFGVLIRFREGRIGVVADIKEMFLQIKVTEQDRDSLRFLWRGEDRKKPPIEYRMTSLIFGAACSPATAIYVKNRNADCHKEEHPEVATATVRNFYMDDYLGAFSNENEAKSVINAMHKVHLKASFDLRGWASNVPSVIDDVMDKRNSDQTTLGKNDSERTLGMIWNHKRDALGFNVNLRNTPIKIREGGVTPTKRQVTSAVMSVFDPLGLISPLTVVGKALMQDIWRSGVQWDDPITDEHRETWLSFIQHIESVRNIEIPRYVPAPTGDIDMHVFCDASEKIYSTAIYFVNTDSKGNRTSRLVAGKAKVAPLKPVSVPRLELQAAVLGSRLADAVRRETDYAIKKCYFWSDSKTVLAWIKSDPRTFKSFVAHRLAEIESLTAPVDWRWVPSALNPADHATKGVPVDFSAEHRWFFGPEFIKSDPEAWPKEKPAAAPLAPTGEERVIKPVLHVSNNKQLDAYLPSIDRFSSYNRLLRSTATVLLAAERFKANLLKTKTQSTSTDHLRTAELLLIRRSQRSSFHEEIKSKEAGRPLPKNSPLKKIAVNVQQGILYLDSRLSQDGTRRLPVLHAKEQLTKLIVLHTHSTFSHANRETVLNELQQKYYIIGLRGCLRYICNRCQWCRTYKKVPTKIPLGDLPLERTMTYQPPFTATAVDYFGPMQITVGRRHEKRWGALYTCLTTRAIHVELATSLSASSMILTLRRLMARRGAPTVIYSDNATNFIGAQREIEEAQQADDSELIEFAASKSIVWKKIPPGAPSMGGAWERMVRSVKTALHSALKEKYPSEEVLHTLLLEAEHLVNTRPLTPVNPDLEKESLTPNHFLIGRSCGMSPFGSFRDKNLSTKDWKSAQSMADDFWNRWVREYKPLLQVRRGNVPCEQPIKVGDIVLIVDQTMPRGTWPRGQVTSVYPGPDGRVRVTEVRTASGLMRRPASRLIVLDSKTT